MDLNALCAGGGVSEAALCIGQYPVKKYYPQDTAVVLQ